MEPQSNIFISHLDELIKLKLILLDSRTPETIGRDYVLEKLNRAINDIPIVLHPTLLNKLGIERTKYNIKEALDENI